MTLLIAASQGSFDSFVIVIVIVVLVIVVVVVLPIYNSRRFVSAYTHTLIPLQYIIAFCLFRVLRLISSGFLPTRGVTSHEPDSRFCARVVVCVCEGQGRASGCGEVRTAETCADAQWRLDYAVAVVVVLAFKTFKWWLRRILKIKRLCPAVIATIATPRRVKHK